MAVQNLPQIDALKQLVQTNPTMLQQFVSLIGQQLPELLLLKINANIESFLKLMNQPIVEAPSTAATQLTTFTPSPTAPSNPGYVMPQKPGGTDPAPMAQMM